jgi:hypothetical protein
MAALVAGEQTLILAGLRNTLRPHFPPTRGPMFLRMRNEADLTGTFKYSKTELMRQGYDPAASDPTRCTSTPGIERVRSARQELYDRIQAGNSLRIFAFEFGPKLACRGLQRGRRCKSIKSGMSSQALESAIADGPVVPSVTAEEIRAHLQSRYDFKQRIALEEVVADVETMLRKWQVQVTHPRYFGLFNPSVTWPRSSPIRWSRCTTRSWPTGAPLLRRTRWSGTRLAGSLRSSACPQRLHRDIYQRRNGGEPLRGRGRAHPCLSRVRRAWPAQPGRRAGNLPHRRGSSRLQQDRPHDRARPAQRPHHRHRQPQLA